MKQNDIETQARRIRRYWLIVFRITAVSLTLCAAATLIAGIMTWGTETPLPLLACVSGGLLTINGGLTTWLTFVIPLDDGKGSTPGTPNQNEKAADPAALTPTVTNDIDPRAGFRRAIRAARGHLGKPLKPIVIRGNGWGWRHAEPDR